MQPDPRWCDCPTVLPIALVFTITAVAPVGVQGRAHEPIAQSAIVSTAVATAVSGASIGVTAATMAHRRDEAIEALRRPECNEPGLLGCFELDLFPDLGTGSLIVTTSLFHAGAISWSAAAGHLWARRDLARGVAERRRAIATTTVGSIGLAVGLLEAFLAAYPPPNMPKTVDELESFNPVADGVTVSYQETMTGGEWIDPGEGGITDANVLAGLAESRQRAEMAVPVGAVVLDVREDAVETDLLGDECIASNGDIGSGGIGWAWGSILFETPDTAIGEIVYLYIGLCLDTQDTEGYYHANEPHEVCAPPG